MNDVSLEQRRTFLMRAGAMLGVSVCSVSMAALLGSCEKDESKLTSQSGTVDISIASYVELKNVGGMVKVSFGSYNFAKPVIITRLSETRFLAVSSVCNHQGCEVGLPKTPGGPITCDYVDNKCGHGAEFSPSTGLQIKGPGGGPPTGGLTVIPTAFTAATNVLTLSF
ncbi:MAG: Rieske 2Fe-2S domain-containing protein [Candidatus Kapaibacterium sp.]